MGEPSQPGVNRSTGTGTARTTQTGLRFLSGHAECEEKTIDWKIDDVADFLQMSNTELADNGITFEAGTCILRDGTRIPANWKYYLKHTNENEEDWVGGFLFLQNENDSYTSTVKSAKACYSVSLSSGDNLIAHSKMTASDTKNGHYFEPYSYSGCGVNKWVTKSKLLDKTKGTDVLEVSLLLKVFSSHRFKPVLVETLAYPSELELLQVKIQANADFGKLLASGDGADIEVKVPSEVGGENGESFYTKQAHKSILIGRSPVFSKMFAKDSLMVEAQSGQVVIRDLSPKGLDIFLHFLYTGEVLEDWVNVAEEIFNAADKYDVGSLMQYCSENLMSAVSTSNAWRLYQVAKLHKLSAAKNAIAKFVSKNAKAALDGDEGPSDEETGRGQGQEEGMDDKSATSGLPKFSFRK